MITVYTGNGKGKTTSALGDALLAQQNHKKPLIVQFLKGSTYSGELMTFHHLGIPIFQFGVGCRWSGMIRTGLRHCNGCGECFRSNRDPLLGKELVAEAMTFLGNKLTDRSYDFIVLDEVSHALIYGFLELVALIKLMTTGEGKGIDWVLTGRKMTEELLPIVDAWWDLRMIKHPFQRGIPSRGGIEY